jgi:hypothetical protein
MLENILTEEFLTEQFIILKKSKAQVAREIKSTIQSINRYLKKFNFTIKRSTSPIFQDLTGLKFGRWLVIKRHIHTGKNTKWFCICDCGKKKLVAATSLVHNLSKSCGCLKRDIYSNGYKNISGIIWKRLLKSCEDRGIEIKISIKDAWDKFVEQNGKCALTGIELIMLTDASKAAQTTASLDRIDSSKGYTKDNIQWVHKRVNFMKSNMTSNELIFWANKISITCLITSTGVEFALTI